MKGFSFLLLVIILTGCSGFSVKGDPVQNSDRILDAFVKEMATIYPEMGSAFGLSEYDDKATTLGLELEGKEQKVLQQFKLRLSDTLRRVENPQLKLDLLLLKDKINESIKLYEIGVKYKILPFNTVSSTIFNNLAPLLSPGTTKAQNLKAIERLKKYVAPENGKPYPIAAIELFNHKVMTFSGEHFYPSRPEVDKYLKESRFYVEALARLLSTVDDDSWRDYFSRLIVYIQTYDNFVENRILPYSRKSVKLPEELYLLFLRGQGIDLSPERIYELGRRDFLSLWSDFEKLANKLAKNWNLPSNRPKDVMNFLKKKKIDNATEAMDLFATANAKIVNIVKKHNLVSLNNVQPRMRIVSLGQNSSSPIPHLEVPPLVTGTKKRPEFLIPIDEKGVLAFDDFSYQAAVLPIMAHEVTPGHNLQFSYIFGQPISLIRSRYTNNTVNIEGWAAYAERLLWPYLNDAEKFVFMQTLLWRIARYYLDPGIQLGKYNRKKVEAKLNELGVSPYMTKAEYERFAFFDPAQATGFYHGYLEILEFKESLSRRGKLNELCFNDTFLKLGLVPLKYLSILETKFSACLAP